MAARVEGGVAEVPPGGDPARYGDEPVLMAALSGARCGWARPPGGRARAAGGAPRGGCDHRRRRPAALPPGPRRGDRRGGRGDARQPPALPAGPLREGVGRLAEATWCWRTARFRLACAPRWARARCSTSNLPARPSSGSANRSERGCRRISAAGACMRWPASAGRSASSGSSRPGLEVIERRPFPDHHASRPPMWPFPMAMSF
jgi:hypothetical protein